MISKLYPVKTAQQIIEDGNKGSIKYRNTGRTTGNCLATIGNAMQAPNCPITICHIEHKEHIDTMRNLISNMLELKHLVISQRANYYYLTYDIFYQQYELRA